MSTKPVIIAASGIPVGRISFVGQMEEPVRLAFERLSKIGREELDCELVIHSGQESSALFRVLILLPVQNRTGQSFLEKAEVSLTADGTIAALSQERYGDQGFLAGRGKGENGEYLWLAANSQVGLKNAILTLGDRLYRDEKGDLVADDFEGVHCPAFESRFIKTDAMNCGRFRSRLEYWDSSDDSGVNEFSDWLASFRITDYNLITFMRGWGLTYACERYPGLIDPQHPNPSRDYYARVIDRFHGWGVKTWAADVYMGSGYSMEVGMCPEMLSPCVDRGRLRPFRAGEGSLVEILCEPEAIACLSHPAAGRYYTEIVRDLLEHYPRLDGLDFHLGHMFPGKICRCPKCNGIHGNRLALYRCFQKVYQAAVDCNPGIRLKAAVKIFGDATREIVEHYHEFPNLEFFSWMRWIGNFTMERTDAPVTTGHEDGGGGLEANNQSMVKNMESIRGYYRDYEPWVRTYIQMAKTAGLKSISWEPALHREIEQMFFVYSQLTWEPELSWGELARRYVLRSKRRIDETLIKAYTLALEINASITSYGFIPHENACCGRMVQNNVLLKTSDTLEKVLALEELLHSMGIVEYPSAQSPVFFDLEWSLSRSLTRFRKGEALEPGH